MMNSNIISVTGIMAGLLTAVSALPQLIKMLQENKYEAVSPWRLLILLIGMALWILYVVLKGTSPLLLRILFHSSKT